MSLFRNTQDIKKDTLSRAGELTDGTSDFDADAIKYINDAYHGLFAGGSEFGVDVDENWVWAKSRFPVTLTLLPAETTGTVTLTLGSTDGTFSTAHATSQQGRYLKIDSRSEYFIIRQHTAGATAFELDHPYTEASGTFNFKSIPLEYEIANDQIVIDSYNNILSFRDTSGTQLESTITPGVYTPTTLATEIKTQMESDGGQTYTISFDSITRKFSLSSDGATFFLDFASGATVERSIAPYLGFSAEDLSGELEYEATDALNSIYRFFGPIQVFRSADASAFLYPGVNAGLYTGYSTNAGGSDRGKIYATDLSSLITDYPLIGMTEGVPDKFAIVQHRDNGTLRVRFNRYPREKTRVLAELIEHPLDLTDSTASVPLVPRAFRSYLVHAAAYYIMLDKSDNRADIEFNLARAKLQGLIKYNRATLKLAGDNFGRLIPRRG